jgi:hypothetical protein
MSDFSSEELKEAYRAILSLRNKSQKAAGKLKEGTWQKDLTTRIVSASDVALSLISGGVTTVYGQETLAESLATMKDTLRRAEEVIGKFLVGTSQHTIQKNRIAALKVALALIEKEQSHHHHSA